MKEIQDVPDAMNWYFDVEADGGESFNITEAIACLRKGWFVAEVRKIGVVESAVKIYRYDKEFFQLNTHLGTYIQTSTFDMVTTADAKREFRLVIVLESGAMKEKEEEGLMELNLPPSFFELDDGTLCNIINIISCNILHGYPAMLYVTNQSFTLNEKELERFKKFTNIHGVFGRDK